MDIVRLEDIEDKLIIVQGEKVLLDSDVGEIYGVETKRINEAVKNNPDKFPTRLAISWLCLMKLGNL